MTQLRALSLPAFAFTVAMAVGPAALAALPPGVVNGTMRLGAGSFVNGLPDIQGSNDTYSAPVTTGRTVTGGVATAVGTLNLIAAPFPGISTHAVLTSPPTGSANASADITGFEFYSFRVTGPTDTVDVHVDAIGHVGISAISVAAPGDFVSATSFFQIREFVGPEVVGLSMGIFGDVRGLQDSAFPGIYGANPLLTQTINGDFSLRTNTIYEVRLRSTIHGVAYEGGVTDVFADIFPTFTIDAPYSFEFSEGFGGGIVRDGGGGAVPEPATWALMIAGFGAVGAMSRRRRALAA